MCGSDGVPLPVFFFHWCLRRLYAAARQYLDTFAVGFPASPGQVHQRMGQFPHEIILFCR